MPPTTLETFSSRIFEAGRNAADPWAGAHLLLAFPQDPRLETVRQKWIGLIEDEQGQIPLHGDEGHRGEQHPHLLLRTAAWVLPGTHDPHLKNRVKKALSVATLPQNWKQVNDLAWLVEAAAVLDFDATTPTAEGDLARLAVSLLVAIEESDQIVQRCLDEGLDRPDGAADPSRAGTWAYTCGGFHLLSALVESGLAGYFDDDEQQRLVDRLVLMTRRIPWELQFRLAEEQRAQAAGVSPRRAARHSVLARMKLAGHGLDVLGRARVAGLLSTAQAKNAATSCLTAAELIQVRFLDEVDPQGVLLSAQTEAIDSLTWERAFGDGCHLLRGLTVWYSVSQK